MEIKQKIIDFLESTRMSTEEIGDVLGKTGVVKDVKPILSGSYAIGEIQYFYAHSNSNWSVHEQLVDLKPGKIAFFDTHFVDDYAVFGELVSVYIMKNKLAKAIIVNGLMRDLAGLQKRRFPVWCKGITPIGCFNVKIDEVPQVNRLVQKNREYYEGSIAVCDDSGVVIIPKEEINDLFIEKMKQMINQEKTWFDCVENKGWSTYDTVCLKKYRGKIN